MANRYFFLTHTQYLRRRVRDREREREVERTNENEKRIFEKIKNEREINKEVKYTKKIIHTHNTYIYIERKIERERQREH